VSVRTNHHDFSTVLFLESFCKTPTNPLLHRETSMKGFLRSGAIILLMLVALLSYARRENSGWVSYSSPVGRIFLMTSDGRHHHPITRESVCASNPIRSPDGNRIVAWNPCAGTLGIAHFRPNSLRSRAVTLSADFEIPIVWSPTGEHAVVEVMFSNEREIGSYLIDADGNIERYLGSEFYTPFWSPDGTWIYNTGYSETGIGLHRIHAVTGDEEEVFSSFRPISQFSWSPDSARIVFVTSGDMGTALGVMAADGNDFRVIAVDRQSERIIEPRWSPDGEWIAFLGGLTLRNLHVYRIRPDGHDPERLSEEPGGRQGLTWSPDGKWLLYTESSESGNRIVRVRSDGAAREQLTGAQRRAYAPQVSPISGRDWHPLPLTFAAFGMLIVSVAFPHEAIRVIMEWVAIIRRKKAHGSK
jgi:Tol biopolymer transport system component